MTSLAYYLLGVVLGAGSSVIPGPCGLAVIDAATRLGRQRALATAAGAALGDLTYAALGIFSVGHLLADEPDLAALLLALGGVVLIGYGITCLRRAPLVDSARTTPVRAFAGLAVGFVTLACNPGALVTWSAIVGAQLASATQHEQLCAVLGIGSGSLAWFSGMALLSARGTRVIGPHMQRIVQVVGVLIVVYGALSVARAVL